MCLKGSNNKVNNSINCTDFHVIGISSYIFIVPANYNDKLSAMHKLFMFQILYTFLDDPFSSD